MTDTATKPDAASFFTPGTIAERVELMMGVLTQGVVDSMIFATGAFPQLTEGQPAGPNAFQNPKPGAVSTWQSARSTGLHDAARLTEAGARLLASFAKYRGQFRQDFTIRHNEKRKAGDPKNRLRNTTVTHSFSVPGRDTVSEQSVDPTLTDGLTRNLAKVADDLSRGNDEADKQRNEAARAELCRRLGMPCEDEAPAPGDDAAPAAGDPPPPPPKS